MYRLFISHSWEYSERYLAMVRLLDSAPFFSYANYSIPETKAFGMMVQSRMQEELRQQIRPAQCVIILGGMWYYHSDWIGFEVAFAKSLKKPILGVRPRGAKVMPRAVSEVSDVVVNWSSVSVIPAIRTLCR